MSLIEISSKVDKMERFKESVSAYNSDNENDRAKFVFDRIYFYLNYLFVDVGCGQN